QHLEAVWRDQDRRLHGGGMRHGSSSGIGGVDRPAWNGAGWTRSTTNVGYRAQPGQVAAHDTLLGTRDSALAETPAKPGALLGGLEGPPMWYSPRRTGWGT